MAGPDGSPKAVLAALTANAGIAVAKFLAFFVTGSASMLAEAIHSVADTSNQGLLLLGRRLSGKKASKRHPFGYGQEAYFWAFLVAIILFTVGALFSLYEGVDKLRHPHEVTSVGWAIGVLLMAVVFESFALRLAVKEANKQRTGSWWRYIKETRAPETAVVVLEDTAALTGLAAALGGLVLAMTTGDPRWDAAGSLAIGVVLAIVAVVLAIEMRSLLLGESAREEDVAAVHEALSGFPVVERLIDLRTMHLGPHDMLVAARIEFDERLDIDEASEWIAKITTAIRDAVPAARRVYIEPEASDRDATG